MALEGIFGGKRAKLRFLTIVKALIYFFGFISNLFGCVGFLLLFISWVIMTSRWLYFLFPLLLLQISQPNWFAFMWHRVRRRGLDQIGGLARHRGVWWRFFLTASPFFYFVATGPPAILLFIRLLGDEVGVDSRPVIRFLVTNRTSMEGGTDTSYDCKFALTPSINEGRKWRNAVLGMYPECREDRSLLMTNQTDQALELGNQLIVSPGTYQHVGVRCLAIFFGVAFNLIQMWVFRKKKSFSRRVIVWPILLAIAAIACELAIMYNQEFQKANENEITFAVWVFIFATIFFIIVLTPLFLLCKKCCACCCRCCCDV